MYYECSLLKLLTYFPPINIMPPFRSKFMSDNEVLYIYVCKNAPCRIEFYGLFNNFQANYKAKRMDPIASIFSYFIELSLLHPSYSLHSILHTSTGCILPFSPAYYWSIEMISKNCHSVSSLQNMVECFLKERCVYRVTVCLNKIK